jgi:hypothetical protein
MKRVIVLGGAGFFGGLIAQRLAGAGLQPVIASRSRGELRIDADNPEDLRKNLKQRDLVIDAAGPFQNRTLALIEAARTIGFDVIDLSDSPEYTSMIYEHEAPIRAAGIRVLTACSALSAVSAAVVQWSGIERPQKLSAYLVPASRYTANAGTIGSFLHSIEGARRIFHFPEPLGNRTGITVKSVDAVTLPPIFPTLHAEFVVDAGANELLRSRTVRAMIERFQTTALKIVRRIGNKNGVLAFEVTSTLQRKQQVFMGERSYMLAALPAIQAALSIAGGRFPHRGLVPPTQHLDPAAFFEAVRAEGIVSY